MTQQETQDAQLALSAAEAEYADLKVRLDSQLLNDQAEAARIDSEYRQALLQFEADDRLLREGLIPDITQKLSKLKADELKGRTEIEARKVEITKESNAKQLASQQARLEQTRALYDLRGEWTDQSGRVMQLGAMPRRQFTVVTMLYTNCTVSCPRILVDLKRIEAVCEVPIDLISTGADREETIVLHHPFE